MKEFLGLLVFVGTILFIGYICLTSVDTNSQGKQKELKEPDLVNWEDMYIVKDSDTLNFNSPEAMYKYLKK